PARALPPLPPARAAGSIGAGEKQGADGHVAPAGGGVAGPGRGPAKRRVAVSGVRDLVGHRRRPGTGGDLTCFGRRKSRSRRWSGSRTGRWIASGPTSHGVTTARSPCS